MPYVIGKRPREIERQIVGPDAPRRALDRHTVPTLLARNAQIALVVHHGNEHALATPWSGLANYPRGKSSA